MKNNRSLLLMTVAAALTASSAVTACSSASNAGGSGGSSAPGGAGGNASGTGGKGIGGSSGSAGGTGQGGSGTTGAGGSPSASGGADGGASSGFCPTDHIFCADFEQASGPPTGAFLAAPDESNLTFGTPDFMVLDTTAPFAGRQSFKVTSPGSFHYRMLGVTVPATFWVRLYIKSDQDIGQPDHNAFFEAMTTPDYHPKTGVELSEQFSCLLLNKSDTLFPPNTTACGSATALVKNVWHCMVAQFDGIAGNVQIFVGQTRILNAVAWPPAQEAFTTFEFGYGNFNSPGASVWYDNVAISAAPLACP